MQDGGGLLQETSVCSFKQLTQPFKAWMAGKLIKTFHSSLNSSRAVCCELINLDLDGHKSSVVKH